MSATEDVYEVLGGPKVFKGRVAPSSAEVRDRIKQGLPFSAFESVRDRMQLSVPETATVLQMPPRTLARRKQARRLAADESDRLYRLARVMALAAGVFGSDEKGTLWLRRPNRALGGDAPLSLLDTDLGARQVEDTLGRVAHGIVG